MVITKRLIIFFTCLIFPLLIQSCSNNTPNMERQIEKALAAKYAEDFKVNEVYFEKGLNLYVFEAHPVANKNIVFQGQFDERAASVEKQLHKDSYPNYTFKAEASKEMEQATSSKMGPHKAGATLTSAYKHQFGNKLISFEEYLSQRPKGSVLHFDLYLFETPSSADEKVVDAIREMIQALQAKFKNNFFVKIGFWNKEVLGGKSVNAHSYGFTSTGEDDLDNVVNKLKHLKKEFLIEVVSGSVESLDNEKVFGLIKDRKAGAVNAVKI